jgi:hypothetical protein
MQDHSPDKRLRLASHIRGLRGMIQQRGGWTALRNSAVAFHLHWSVVPLLDLSTSNAVYRFDMVSAGELSLGLTPPSGYLESTHKGESHLELCVRELGAFYRSLSSQQGSFIASLVKPGSLVGSMLTKLESPFLPERLAVLIYLCTAFNELRYLPSRMQYIDRLESNLAAQSIGLEASLAGVLWSLITDFENLSLECPERMWLLSRMLYVAARLSADLRRKLENQLLKFLMSGRRDDLELEPDDLEAEIWRDIALVRISVEEAGAGIVL